MADQLPVVVLGGGPAGMAAALGLIKAGIKVVVCERYPYARPAGNILNLWPPPIKALKDMGVDIHDIGASCKATFRDVRGNIRATIKSPEVNDPTCTAEFVGLLRPDLYTRMLEAIPEGVMHFNKTVVKINDDGELVTLHFEDGSTIQTPLLIGADGIDSFVRAHLWGTGDLRPHNMHVIGGYTFDAPDGTPEDEIRLSHGSRIQGTFSSIVSQGRRGYQWWVVEAWPDEKPGPADLKQHAQHLGADFAWPLPGLISRTDLASIQRWPIRDRRPLKRWSEGRITLTGDAAHATSPYAAYGAGMSICDGYWLGQILAPIDLRDTAAVHNALMEYDERRIPHTTEQVEQAYFLGRLFHHTPWPLTYLRDFVLDYTPFLQWTAGDHNPRVISNELIEMGAGILQPKSNA